jgi:hypothetical protein
MVGKTAEWNPIGMRSKRCPKNGWGDEVLNELNQLKVKNWTYVIKDRKSWYELVQKIKTHKELWCQQQNNKYDDVCLCISE